MKTIKNGNDSVKSPWYDFCQLSKLRPSDQKSRITHLDSFSTSKFECSKRKYSNDCIQCGFSFVKNKDCP